MCLGGADNRGVVTGTGGETVGRGVGPGFVVVVTGPGAEGGVTVLVPAGREGGTEGWKAAGG